MVIYAQRLLPHTNKTETLVFSDLVKALYFFGIPNAYDSIQKHLKRKHYCSINTNTPDLPIGYSGSWTLTPEEE